MVQKKQRKDKANEIGRTPALQKDWRKTFFTKGPENFVVVFCRFRD